MKTKIITEKGLTEVIVEEDCELDKFYKVADLLSNHFNLIFLDKLVGLDTIYWDFEYNGNDLVLHFNVFMGISIFPKELKSATQTNNESVVEIATLLFQKLINRDWSDFENGMTIGTIGSESGTILQDIENSNGARITLEKKCGGIPFAITTGIYGLLFHTHFERDIEKVNEFIAQTKYKVNEIFDLNAISEENRDDSWHSKHDKKINELTKMTEILINDEKSIVDLNLLKVHRPWWKRLLNN